MSWEDIVKFERNFVLDGESYVEQIKKIKEDIEKVISYLDLTTFFGGNKDGDIQTAIKMLNEIDTEV